MLTAMLAVVCFSQNSFSQTSIDINHFKSVNKQDYEGKKLQKKFLQPAINKKQKQKITQTKPEKIEIDQNQFKKSSPEKVFVREIPQIEYNSTQPYVITPQQIKAQPVRKSEIETITEVVPKQSLPTHRAGNSVDKTFSGMVANMSQQKRDALLSEMTSKLANAKPDSAEAHKLAEIINIINNSN